MSKFQKRILVTGVAGFIGAHLCNRLLSEGYEVIGLDNLNDYYDRNLKKDRLKKLIASENIKNFQFFRGDLIDRKFLSELFQTHRPNIVINLAAQAGVRFSLENPDVYISSNIQGFLNIIEECKDRGIEHLIYASTSSVYGASTDMPFSEDSSTDHPIQFYAVTKKTNELTAHAYSSLYGLPTTGLRFFTVYGPWGRPDMSLFLFTKNIIDGKPISLFNNGDHSRSFTYVDDLVETISKVSLDIARSDNNWDSSNPTTSSSNVPYRILNIRNPQTVTLNEFVSYIEESLEMKAIKELMPLQQGDIRATEASNKIMEKKYGKQSYTSLKVGVNNFIKWYRDYYRK